MLRHMIFFTAQVETVALLKNPPTIVRSPYKGRLTRRPQHRPQIPTRGEQVNAAAAFVSHPDFDSTSDSANSGARAQAPAITVTSIVPIVPTPINTPPPYAAQPSTSELASAASAASSITTVTSESDEEVRSITQLSSLKRKLAD